MSSGGDEAPLSSGIVQDHVLVASPNLVLGVYRQTRKTEICIGPSLPQVEAGMEAMVKFGVFFTDSSQENRQGQQALARSFEGRTAHLSVCLGLCRQPSALITEL